MSSDRVLTHLKAALNTGEIARDDVWRLLERCEARANTAARIVLARLLACIVVWVICVGIGRKMISEGSIASFSVRDLSAALIVGPVLFAVLYHDALSAMARTITFFFYSCSCYEYLLPQLADGTVDMLARPINFVETEALVIDATDKLAARLLRPSSWLIISFSLLLPFTMLAHLAIILWSADLSVPVGIKIVIIAVSAFAALRGLAIRYAVSDEARLAA